MDRAGPVQRLHAFTSRTFAAIVALAVVAGLVVRGPWEAVLPYRGPLLAFNVFAVSVGISWRDLSGLRRLGRFAAGLYGVMFLVTPAVAVAVGRLWLRDDPALAQGLLLLASMPAGAMAAVWTGLLGGNTGLSLTAVGLTTLTCGVVTPLVLQLFGGAVLAVRVDSLARNLAVNVALPALAGVLAGNRWPQAFRRARPWMGLALQLSIVAIVGATAFEEKPMLSSPAAQPVLARLVALCAGYLLGLMGLGSLASRALSADPADRISLTLSVALRNNNAAVLLAAAYLSSRAALPSIVMLLIQQPLVWVAAKAAASVKPALARADPGRWRQQWRSG